MSMDHKPDRYVILRAGGWGAFLTTGIRLNVHVDKDGIVKDVKMG
jgi:hypothetical protein